MEGSIKLLSIDKTFRAYSLDQRLLLPPDLREWLPDGDLALFISDVLEQEAQARAAQAAEVARAKLAAREQRAGSAKGAVPKVPDVEQARPEPGAQHNFTDPESRIMKDSASKEFVQAYNAQIAVDSRAQGIVACDVTAVASECRAVRADAGDRWRRIPANCRPSSAPMPGTFSETNLTAPELAAIDCYVPPDRQTHGGEPPRGHRRHPLSESMRAKLQTAAGRAIYARRKTLPEPVFGQIKQARGFRRFWLRGVRKVRGEWALICLTHNLLKLFGARTRPVPA